jgi:HJR/Mrr/RecB family endonuclease
MKIFISFAAADWDRVGPLMASVREAGFDVASMDYVLASSAESAVASEILSSQVIVAIISSANPNVFYELGLAVGAGLPAVIAAIGDVSLPSDLASMPLLRLTGDVARDASSLLLHLDSLNLAHDEQKLPSGTPEEILAAVASDAQLLEKLSPAEFERMVGELLESRGWSVERSGTRKGADIDLILSDPDTEKVTVVEVKKINSQGRVSVDAVRQLLSYMAIMGAHSGILVSTAGFTSSALAMAAGTGAVLVTLRELLSSRSRLSPSDVNREDR